MNKTKEQETKSFLMKRLSRCLDREFDRMVSSVKAIPDPIGNDSTFTLSLHLDFDSAGLELFQLLLAENKE